MSIPGAASPLFLTSAAAAEAGYQIDRSLRFNSGDSAYLNRTPSSAGNRKTWTWSGWLKRSDLVANTFIFGAGSGIMVGGAHTAFMFTSDDKLQSYDYTGSGYAYNVVTSMLFRDPAAWYHIVLAIDTTQSTSTDRVKLYVNGELQTALDTTTYPSQNYDTYVNTASLGHQIGHSNSDSFDGYLTEVYFIDGQRLAPTDFGEYDSNSVWQPKEFTGTYGPLVDQSQTWSSSTFFDDNGHSYYNSGGTITKLFDNDLGSSGSNGVWILPVDGGTFELNFTQFSSATTVTFDLAGTGNALKINGSFVTIPGSGSETTATFNVSGLTKIEWLYNGGSNYCYLGSISVDGVLLVDNGVTVPDNSFYLKFADNTSTTTIAEDSSGNDNDWTANNISVSSGSGNDSLIDTPTNYTADSANNGGSYCTLNPLQSATTLSNGNLDSAGGSGWSGTAGTFGMSSGKWYFEYDNVVSNEHIIGIVPSTTYTLNTLTAYGYGSETGGKYDPVGGSNQSYGNSWTTGDVIGVAFDADNGNLYFYKNGTVQNSGTAAFTGLTSGPYLPSVVQNGSSRSASLNFGQRPFAYTPPTGYVSLCTTNLPDPTIADGSTAFEARTYDGVSGASSQTGYKFSPDFVWIKRRNSTNNHTLTDSVRGAGYILQSHNTNAEIDNTAYFTGFTSDGFSFGTDGGDTDAAGGTYVAWAWDAGSSTVSNTDGSITSNVRANASAGCSIVTYTGTGSAASIGHGLNAAPELVIVKSRSAGFSWIVWHGSFGTASNTDYLFLESNAAKGGTGYDFWNGTAPTSSVVNIGTQVSVNKSTETYVAYCFAPVEGFSSFGSYTGNGSSDGPFVFTGHRPRFLIIKCSTKSGEDWLMLDTARDAFNDADSSALYASLSHQDNSTSTITTDILSNGFKARATNAAINESGQTYVYMSFASHPFKTARAR